MVCVCFKVKIKRKMVKESKRERVCVWDRECVCGIESVCVG